MGSAWPGCSARSPREPHISSPLTAPKWAPNRTRHTCFWEQIPKGPLTALNPKSLCSPDGRVHHQSPPPADQICVRESRDPGVCCRPRLAVLWQGARQGLQEEKGPNTTRLPPLTAPPRAPTSPRPLSSLCIHSAAPTTVPPGPICNPARKPFQSRRQSPMILMGALVHFLGSPGGQV